MAPPAPPGTTPLGWFSCSIHLSYMNSYNMYTTYTVIFFHEFICESLWRCRLLSVHNILVKHCLKNWEVSQLSGVSIRRQAGLAVRCCTGRLYTAIHDDGEKMLTSIHSIYIRTLIARKSALKWHNYRMFWSPIIVLSKQIIGDQNIR